MSIYKLKMAMKRLAFIFFILISKNGISQMGQIIGTIQAHQTDLKLGINLILEKDSFIMKTSVNDTGYFSFSRIPVGVYNLTITETGVRDSLMNGIIVSDDSLLKLKIKYPPECPFDYSKDFKPKCIGGHTDSIVPIVYGLPGAKLRAKAEKELIHLGGCLITECDPKYFCLIHKKEL